MNTSHTSLSPARERAMRVLTTCYDGRLLCRDVLDELQAARPLAPQDAALATELVIGLSRRRITAEHIVSRMMRGRFKTLDPQIRVILALGVYQLCWLDRIPDHAAVDQAVRLAKQRGQRHVASLVNAVLRRVAEIRGEVVAADGPHDARRYLPLDAARGRRLTMEVFPDPARRPLEYYEAAYGLPPFLIERWHRRFKGSGCRQICEAAQQRPPLVLRANSIRTTPEKLVDRLRSDGIAAARLDDSPAIVVPPPADDSALPPLHQWPSFTEGLFQPQDSAAQSPLCFAAPAPGSVVLDLCAGVGTKSTQAAELMNNAGLVLATDLDERKLEKIAANARRLGLDIIETVPLNQLDQRLARLDRPVDLILIDAPCSNTGVLARRPEARYRATHKNLLAHAATQTQLLHRAAELAGPHTHILYTTCSIEQEENEEQVKQFCEKHPDWTCQHQSLTLPTSALGGGFFALLARRSEPRPPALYVAQRGQG